MKAVAKAALRARTVTSAPGPCLLTGFDVTNLAGALEQLEGAQASLEAVRPRDAHAATRLQRLGGELTELIGELRDLRGAQ